MSLAGIPRTICAPALALLLLFGFGFQSAVAANEPDQPVPTSPFSANPIDQALSDIKSDDAAARSKAAAFLIEQGDANLIPKLDEIREEADRAVRQADQRADSRECIAACALHPRHLACRRSSTLTHNPAAAHTSGVAQAAPAALRSGAQEPRMLRRTRRMTRGW